MSTTLVACGGGTTGTGGAPRAAVTISGMIGLPDDSPLQHVLVTAKILNAAEADEDATGMTTTDGTGSFRVTAKISNADKAVLLFTAPRIAGSYVLPSLPVGASRIQLDLTFDPDTGEITPEREEIDDENGKPL